MAAKYQLITELYRRTGIAVAKNPQEWQSFLAAACRNYKCRFDEQLLIYAQRPPRSFFEKNVILPGKETLLWRVLLSRIKLPVKC